MKIITPSEYNIIKKIFKLLFHYYYQQEEDLKIVVILLIIFLSIQIT